MTSNVEIRMTPRGFEVATATQTIGFPTIESALRFAHERLERARALRELSEKCE